MCTHTLLSLSLVCLERANVESRILSFSAPLSCRSWPRNSPKTHIRRHTSIDPSPACWLVLSIAFIICAKKSTRYFVCSVGAICIKLGNFSVCSVRRLSIQTPSCAAASKLANSVAGVICHFPCFAHRERANK